jgi:uncharacterized integral membrane protein (TIGR02327 family)
MDDISTTIGQQGIIAIIVYLCCIAITWWAIQAIDLTKIMKKNHVNQIRTLYIIVSIALGFAIGNFFLEYYRYARNITYLF